MSKVTDAILIGGLGAGAILIYKNKDAIGGFFGSITDGINNLGYGLHNAGETVYNFTVTEYNTISENLNDKGEKIKDAVSNFSEDPSGSSTLLLDATTGKINAEDPPEKQALDLLTNIAPGSGISTFISSILTSKKSKDESAAAAAAPAARLDSVPKTLPSSSSTTESVDYYKDPTGGLITLLAKLGIH